MQVQKYRQSNVHYAAYLLLLDILLNGFGLKMGRTGEWLILTLCSGVYACG